MKKFSFFMVFGLAVVVLSGCSGDESGSEATSTMSSGDDAAMETSLSGFGVGSCDEYVKVMECVIEKSPAAGQSQSKQALDDAMDAWKQIPEAQLKPACDQAMETIRSMKDTYAQLGCEVN